VSVDTGKGPWFFGQTLAGTVHGAYYFGAPLAGAEARWTLSRSPGYYAPPNNDGFSFATAVGDTAGKRTARASSTNRRGAAAGRSRARNQTVRRGRNRPSRREGRSGGEDAARAGEAERRSEETDSSRHGGHRTRAFTLEATVFDKNRQAIANRSSFVVHPADLYVGMRTTRSIIKEKEKIPSR